MDKLGLPPIDCNIRKNHGKVEIFDIIRKKYVQLLPEEWVRQHVIHFLINHKNYPKGLIRVESGLKYNQLQKRSDVQVFDNEGKCLLLVECKSPKLKLNQEALNQLTMYNKIIQAPFIWLTNGINNFCCQLSSEQYSFLDNIPEYKKSAHS